MSGARRPARFHWRLIHGGETHAETRGGGAAAKATGLPDLERQAAFCRAAERAGITGLLMDVGAAKPDPILLATALGRVSESIEIIVAWRSAFCSPTLFAQQLNTLSQLIDGRFSLNIVAGHSPHEQHYYGDFLDHDQRYARTDEFLAVCHGLWNGAPVDFVGEHFCIQAARLNTPYRASPLAPSRRAPFIFIGGGSEAARRLAVRQGDCWMRIADTPQAVARSAAPVLEAGKELGLRLGVLARSTRKEAHAAAAAVVAGLASRRGETDRESHFMARSDSVSIRATYELAESKWLNDVLWTGAVRTFGGPAISLVGSHDDVARALVEYERVGVSHFILSGWPKLEEMVLFGEEVLPRVRRLESTLDQ